MRSTVSLLLASAALFASACIDEGPSDSPGPDEAVASSGPDQCRELVAVFCVAAESCGFDDAAGSCLDYYGAMCSSNQTIVTGQTLVSARVDLSVYECAPNEAWITWADPSGQAILDAMLVWAAN
jgi:hypothetical protein